MAETLLEVKDVTKSFPVRRDLLGRTTRSVQALRGVSLTLGRAETLGIVGESGSGKSTLARVVARLDEPDTGSIHLQGVDISRLHGRKLRRARRPLQMVFQDPYSSLNPLWTVEDLIAEPIDLGEGLADDERADRVRTLLSQVGLDPDMARRYPSEFSGGQRQRIAIARSLAADPQIVICDEAVSALDVATQAQVVQLLSELRDLVGASYLFIAHDLPVVTVVSDRIAVMYLGRIVEHASTERLVSSPLHPYTQALLQASPVPDPIRQRSRQRLHVTVPPPSPHSPPSGCAFRTRCPVAQDVCAIKTPPLRLYEGGHQAACHLIERTAASEEVS